MGMGMILVALVAGILPPLPQDYSPDYYQWCMANLQQGSSYCCSQAGGYLTGFNAQWLCLDPELKGNPNLPALLPQIAQGQP